MKIYKEKLNKNILFPFFIFMLISLISVFSASNILNNNTIFIKQIIWYILGILIILFITKINNYSILKYYKLLYIIGNLLLLLLLLFAKPINNSKCWFNILGITIQPSEFMKIILIITNSIVIRNNIKNKEYIIILKVFILTLIPSILTFLEPDTGMVIIYFIISFIMLYLSNINRKWFSITFLFIILFISIFLSLYFYNSNLFINIFGTKFFYRIDRLLDWKNGVGIQLSNALISIGSSGLFGFGFNNTPIYFPEPSTDFIFSVYASNYGFIGILLLLITIVYFDINIIKIGIKSRKKVNKLLISGILPMIIYQQVQNIGMNIGLLPITGITLPFISYGGSSLLSYMIVLGIVLNIDREK